MEDGLSVSDGEDVPSRNENLWVYPYVVWSNRLDEPELLVVYEQQMEFLTTSWRHS